MYTKLQANEIWKSNESSFQPKMLSPHLHPITNHCDFDFVLGCGDEMQYSLKYSLIGSIDNDCLLAAARR